jgi:hypothetical protein
MILIILLNIGKFRRDFSGSDKLPNQVELARLLGVRAVARHRMEERLEPTDR